MINRSPRNLDTLHAGYAYEAGLGTLRHTKWPDKADWDFKRAIKSEEKRPKRYWTFMTPTVPCSAAEATWRSVDFPKTTRTYTAYYGLRDNGDARNVSAEDFGNINFGYTAHAYHDNVRHVICPITLTFCLTISQHDVGIHDTAEAKQAETRDQAMIRWGWRLYSDWGRGNRSAKYYYQRPR